MYSSSQSCNPVKILFFNFSVLSVTLWENVFVFLISKTMYDDPHEGSPNHLRIYS